MNLPYVQSSTPTPHTRSNSASTEATKADSSGASTGPAPAAHAMGAAAAGAAAPLAVVAAAVAAAVLIRRPYCRARPLPLRFPSPDSLSRGSSGQKADSPSLSQERVARVRHLRRGGPWGAGACIARQAARPSRQHSDRRRAVLRHTSSTGGSSAREGVRPGA